MISLWLVVAGMMITTSTHPTLHQYALNYTNLARKTSSFLNDNLKGVLPDGSFGGYYNATDSPGWSFCWSNFALLSADAEMVRLLSKSSVSPIAVEIEQHISRMEIVVDWARHYLWNTTTHNGGFFSAFLLSDPSGSDVTKFVDDLSYAGVAMLECFASLQAIGLNNHSLSRKSLQYAAECGDWLLQTNDSAIWSPDQGGYYWNTGEDARAQGIPINANALAVILLQELASVGDDVITSVTGKNFEGHAALWTHQANITLDFLRSHALVSALPRANGQLYRNYVPPKDIKSVIPQIFVYDNALMVRALRTSHLDEDATALVKVIDKYFSLAEYGVYFESSLSGSVSTVFSGWAAEMLLSENVSSSPLKTLEFVGVHLTDQESGAVFQDAYPDGSHRRYGKGTHFTLDCAYGLRYFARCANLELQLHQ